MGPSVTTELHDVVSKVETNHTYPAFANYWAPLLDNDEDDDDETTPFAIINNIDDVKVQRSLKATLKAWIDSRTGNKKIFKRNPSTMILDSGASSHFMRAEERLPITGISTKIVSLPNGETINASHKTELPFPSLTAKARQADVLPGLRNNSLVSVGKFSDADYTTIFHPQGKGVTVHRPGSFNIKLFRKPVLQGWRDANGLWRLSREQQEKKSVAVKETAANVYNLPSIPQMIKYHHASAGFPTKDSWVKAVRLGHYISWPGLTANAVSKFFPESVETQKGHMKKQRQNVRSTKQRVVEDDIVNDEDRELIRALTKQNTFVKVINAEKTVYSDQTGNLPIRSNRGNKLLMIFLM